MRVAYTNHIGSSSRDKHSGKNNAILTISDLAAVEKHNNHDYTPDEVARMQSAINLEQKEHNSQYVMVAGELVKVDGHIDLEANVRQIYEEQFGSAVSEYNNRQAKAGHPGRQIKSYIDHISESKQQEVAVEGLIQFGSLEDWESKSMEERQKAVPLLLEALELSLEQLQTEDAKFILAGASIHLNEGSPHLHYVGVPVQYAPNIKNGPKCRNKKSAVFTRETLGTGLQDNVRAAIEPKLKETFGWEFETKVAGRNKDLTKNQIASTKLQEQIRQQQQALKEAQEQLTAINCAIDAAQRNLAATIEDFGSAQIDEFFSDPESYGNIQFLAMECNPDRRFELEKEGLDLKRDMAQEELERTMGPLMAGLDKTIASIQAGEKKLTWEQRRKCFDAHGEMSNEFWPMREDIQSRYSADLQGKYQARQDAYRHYCDSKYVVLRSKSIISVMLAGIRLIADAKKIQRLNQEIKELQVKQRILGQNTASFARFSREYRDDLKAGKFPGNDLLDSMARIVRQLDQERQAFLDRGEVSPSRDEPSLR